MKLYERIESNNFDEIDKNRAIELIEGGNGHLVYNENYFKLQKENEELSLKYYMLYTEKIENLKAQEVKIKSQVIAIQKVKDKIEEYKNMLKTCNKVKDIDRIKAINERILELEELLEGRK